MNTFTGTVRFSPLEGGFWQFVSDEGTTYHLVGNLKNLKDGKRASVEGQVEKKRLSFGMVGPILRAENIVLLD